MKERGEKKSSGTMQESIKGESAKEGGKTTTKKEAQTFSLIPINYCLLLPLEIIFHVHLFKQILNNLWNGE